MTEQTATASVFLPAREVLEGDLPREVSMEPIISGAPFAYENVVFDGADGFFAVWACDPGVYPRVKDKRGSFMYIISGDATITDEDGTSHELTAGSVIILPYGWVGRWDIRETIRKVYLHTTPVRPFRDGVQPSAFLPAADVPHGDELTVFDGPDGHCAIWAGVPGGYPPVKSEGGCFTYIISGAATITDEAGTCHELTAGSVIALPYGWVGRWDIRETVRMVYVHSTPAPEGAADA